jgi:hypothetical protein
MALQLFLNRDGAETNTGDFKLVPKIACHNAGLVY